MNFTGLGPYKWKYKVNRPLEENEKRSRLDKKEKVSREANDDLSVIRINGTYLELVDRWYAGKGQAVIYGVIGATPMLALVAIGIQTAFEVLQDKAVFFLCITFLLICVFFFCFLFI